MLPQSQPSNQKLSQENCEPKKNAIMKINNENEKNKQNKGIFGSNRRSDTAVTVLFSSVELQQTEMGNSICGDGGLRQSTCCFLCGKVGLFLCVTFFSCDHQSSSLSLFLLCAYFPSLAVPIFCCVSAGACALTLPPLSHLTPLDGKWLFLLAADIVNSPVSVCCFSPTVLV